MFDASHIGQTSRLPGSAAEYAMKPKHTKFSALEPVYVFIPVAIETTTRRSWGSEGRDFFKELGNPPRDRVCDHCSESCLVDQVSIALQLDGVLRDVWKFIKPATFDVTFCGPQSFRCEA